jgi:hypothetical protein
MKKSLFIFVAGFLIVSCSDLNRSEQLRSIDGMSKSIDSLELVLKNNLIDSARKMSIDMQNVELLFKKYYIVDTIDAVFANEINDFKQARKSLGHFQADQNDLTKGCTEMKESLRLLRHDIENGDGDRKKYDEYVAHETSKLNSMQRLAKDYVEQQKYALEVYNRLFSKMNKMARGLMKKNTNKKGI